MRLDVKRILNTPGAELPFRFSMDLSDVEFNGYFPVAEPVEVEGLVRNEAGVLVLSLTARTTLNSVCDRCAKEFRNPKPVDFSCVLAEEKEDEENEDIVLLEEGTVDAEDLARTAFILGMDTKTLCSEDCKGLCPRCGADLNLGPCSCKKEVDPRLAVLAKLLNKSSDEQ